MATWALTWALYFSRHHTVRVPWLNTCHACSLPWRSLMSTWALSRVPLTWSFILCIGTHSAATQLRVIPSCGLPLCEMLTSCGLTLWAMSYSGDVSSRRRLTSARCFSWATGDDPSWWWHISAITDYLYCRPPLLYTATTLTSWLPTFLLSTSSHPMTRSVHFLYNL